MRQFGVFTALALSGMTASCAERMAHPAVIPMPPPPKAASQPMSHNGEAGRQDETLAEDASKRSAIRSHQVTPSASVTPEPSLEPRAPLPQISQQKETPISREPPAAVALSPPLKPAEPNFPIAALMPPPQQPAEPTFPSVPPTVELPSPPQSALPTLPEVPMEAVMPAPPEPAEPSFPVATLLPAPPEPAGPVLSSQNEVAAESPILIPFPDLSAPLSLHPRFEWEDVTGSLDFPLAEAFEIRPERQIPSLIRNPFPLASDTP